MKKIRKCSVICFVIIFWIVLSVLGYLGKDTVYSQYTLDVNKKPYFVFVLEGIHDGIYPWSGKTISLWEKWEQISEENAKDDKENNSSKNNSKEQSGDYGTENVGIDTENTEDGWKNQKRQFQTVEEDYFSDAIFIGDSRTVGLHDYGGLDDATFYATVGLNVYDLWEKEHCEIDGKKMTLEELLTERKFGKIYFQIGINEMGRGTVDGFMGAYAQAIEKFREFQPDAIIFVQGIMKVAKEKSEQDEIFNNDGIEVRNERIAKLADNKNIFYLDMNEVVCDEDGNLRSDLTFDDVHLYGSKYGEWVQFLLEHGIQ